MLLPRRLWTPIRASNLTTTKTIPKTLSPNSRALDDIRTAALTPLSLNLVRHATHASEGRANGAKNGPGKRLGAKVTAEEWVVPGNIIYKQRGTLWFPGENVEMGRDHTLHAAVAGYVKYYRNPALHPKRKYIGVVFNRDDTLPYPPNAARKRRLGMDAVPIVERQHSIAQDMTMEVGSHRFVARDIPRNMRGTAGTTRHGYAPRMANWEIGREAEKSAAKVEPFVKGDRWAAWRKADARGLRITQAKTLRKRKRK
ncbi:hypothetical protein EJ05DRAFT_479108 [Pseudovirgaria hyperparasitica]|uniref:Large ribosomal subunit protein bL27m n=1 Tax=Pseudovirgaria hyperparasitica TaxID=470096 RepID=A0A6A6VVF6_9PEZI|nr:uncharacterized protein EJ05DRAFT_479108 [Pseudovirgaria hyperparasitica]KAF2754668.1 hypothetical protein EJ05DRAFT_479108 [Pseudovirgaria hyperparasitica]